MYLVFTFIYCLCFPVASHPSPRIPHLASLTSHPFTCSDMILRQVAPHLHIPYSVINYQIEDVPIVPTTYGTLLVALSLIAYFGRIIVYFGRIFAYFGSHYCVLWPHYCVLWPHYCVLWLASISIRRFEK